MLKAGLVRPECRLRLPGRNSFNYYLAFILGEALRYLPRRDVAYLAKTVSGKQRDVPVQLARRISVSASKHTKSVKGSHAHRLDNLGPAHGVRICRALQSCLGCRLSRSSIICTDTARREQTVAAAPNLIVHKLYQAKLNPD
jgi:hypothetical protein